MEAAVLFAVLIFFHGVLLMEDRHKVLGIGFVRVFYAEITDDESERDWAGVVFPQARCNIDWRIAVWFEEFCEAIVADAASLG